MTDDGRSGPGSATARGGGSPVDVILPVYGPSPDLGRCLASLRAHTDLATHRVVVVADGPLHEEPARLVACLEASAPGGVLRLESRDRRGYVASTNEGMRASSRDVVLLNSDTEVADGWLENLREAARSAPDIASATPFSNNATLCSLPFPFTRNRVPAGHTVRSFAQLVNERSARSRPRIPTGVGFCLYLRRDALAEAGLFDEERFGLGYGEEVDLCLRLGARGWRHVLDDATYVWHRGGGSFGDETTSRGREAERLLARRHPSFLPRLATFMREDPLRAERARVLDALRPARQGGPRPSPRVLHLAPGWPAVAGRDVAGFARALAEEQARRGDVAVCVPRIERSQEGDDGCELWDAGVRVRLVDEPGSVDGGGLARFLDTVRPEILHVHLPARPAEALLRLARRRGIPILVHLQDERPHEGPRTSPIRSALEAVRARCRLDACRYLAESDAVARSWTDAGLLPGSASVEVLPSRRSSGTSGDVARRISEVYSEILASGGRP